ncbi:MAG: glutaminyl-peptide cyclotransferase [Thermoguttaceae bacterium]
MPSLPATQQPVSIGLVACGFWLRAGWTVALAVATLQAPAAAPRGADRGAPPMIYGYEIVNTYPHDPQAFCQGLVFIDGQLYEGTGQYGQSTLRKVELETGKVLQQVSLDQRLFGEGIAVWDQRIFQLTWQSGVGLVYDRQGFNEIGRFRIHGEGWGLTHNGQSLILSNGTPVIQFLDPNTFRVVRRITVRDQRNWVRNLNELEFVDGVILANVWTTNRIAWISPETGNVTAWIDLEGLTPAEVREKPDAVLNGIAYDAPSKRLFVTGKYWPNLFEIRVVKR